MLLYEGLLVVLRYGMCTWVGLMMVNAVTPQLLERNDVLLSRQDTASFHQFRKESEDIYLKLGVHVPIHWSSSARVQTTGLAVCANGERG